MKAKNQHCPLGLSVAAKFQGFGSSSSALPLQAGRNMGGGAARTQTIAHMGSYAHTSVPQFENSNFVHDKNLDFLKCKTNQSGHKHK